MQASSSLPEVPQARSVLHTLQRPTEVIVQPSLQPREGRISPEPSLLSLWKLSPS